MVVLPMAMDDSMIEIEVCFHNMYKEKMKLQAEKNTEKEITNLLSFKKRHAYA